MGAGSALMAASFAKDALLGIKPHKGLFQLSSTVKQGNADINLVRFLKHFYRCHLFPYTIC